MADGTFDSDLVPGGWFDSDSADGAWFDRSLAFALAAAPPIPGVGPAGAATFALALESGAKVSFEFETDIMKSWNGLEQRVSLLGAPRQYYEASAYLVNADIRDLRGKLVGTSESGSPYLIGLAYEDLTLSADSSGTTVFVSSTSTSDWANNPGQRAVVIGSDGTIASGVIQSSTSGSIVLDVAPGTAGKTGGRIMPAMAVYLDPQQGFARHPVNVEHWQIKARAALFGFGGVDQMGVGASLTTFDGLNVYDRGLNIKEQATDSMLSLSEILDLGGIVTSTGGATVPDWGRDVKMVSTSWADWQWWKRFIYTVRGRQVAFLLPSWRTDFVFVSKTSATTIKIKSGSVLGAGDITKWFGVSSGHQYLQITQTDGSIVYGKISTVGDNGDGTTNVVFTAAIVTGTPAVIGWLELARFENDRFDVIWTGTKFTHSTTARVVQR